MKTLIVLLGGFCLLSTTANAQNTDKKQVKIEKKEVILLKKTPVQLQRVQSIKQKDATTKPMVKEEQKKRVTPTTEQKK